MAYDEKLAERIRAMVTGNDGVTERKMFGGIAFMLGGHMFAGIVKDDLIVRTGPDAYDDSLAQPHARPMDFTGRPSKGMVFVGPAGFPDDAGLRGWIDRGLAFTQTLAPKG